MALPGLPEKIVVDLPPVQQKEDTVRIAAASDLHGTYREVRFPVADVLVLAGDSTRNGTLEEIADLGNWIAEQRYAATIVVSGNHDIAMQTSEAETRRLLRSACYLRDESVTLLGRRFYGSPWVHTYWGAFNRSPGALIQTWSAIPAATDVLVTHMPPHALRDIGSDGRNQGDRGLRARVADLRLLAHIFGHIHEGHGRVRAGQTIFANVAICDRQARPVMPVTLIDL